MHRHHRAFVRKDLGRVGAVSFYREVLEAVVSQFPLCEAAGLLVESAPWKEYVISAAEVEAYLRETTQQNSVKTESVRRNEGANYAEGAENTEEVMQGELVFRAEDFGPHHSAAIIADLANRIFRDWLERQPVVYGWKAANDEWVMDTRVLPEESTHHARLVCVEPLQQDSLEQIARDMLKLYEAGNWVKYPDDIAKLIKRVEQALRAKGG